MRISRPGLFFVVVICILAVSTVWSTACAQEVQPCTGDEVAGTVVEVSGGTVTVDTGTGLCTVTLVGGEYEHPIVELLGKFFGDVSPEHLADALETTQPCAVYDDENGGYVWAECEEGSDAVTVTVVGEKDGVFDIVVLVDGQEVTSTLTVEDSSVAQRLSDALADLVVDWNLDENSAVAQPGDEIATYHDDGMGFGVILKLYAMAEQAQQACEEDGEQCDVTVESLVSAFQSGVGMGELFQLYGKPALLGIGHVRHYERRQADRVRVSDRVRASVQVVKAAKNVSNPRPEKNLAKSDDTGPKADATGKPDHAGPKPKEEKPGKPDHAGPKPKNKDKDKDKGN
jgi:hypothetical protein